MELLGRDSPEFHLLAAGGDEQSEWFSVQPGEGVPVRVQRQPVQPGRDRGLSLCGDPGRQRGQVPPHAQHRAAGAAPPVDLEQRDSVVSPGCGGGAAGGLGGGLGECGGGQRDQRLQSRHAGCEGGAARQSCQTLRHSLAPGGVTFSSKDWPGIGEGNRLYRTPGSERCRAWWQQWPGPDTLWPCPSLSPLPPSTSSLGRRGRRGRCGCPQVSGTNRCGATLT